MFKIKYCKLQCYLSIREQDNVLLILKFSLLFSLNTTYHETADVLYTGLYLLCNFRLSTLANGFAYSRIQAPSDIHVQYRRSF